MAARPTDYYRTAIDSDGMKIAPNRIAVYITAAAALLGGLAPAVANLDLTSTGGIAAGLVALVSITHKWLSGWQAFEANKQWQDHSRFMAELGHDQGDQPA